VVEKLLEYDWPGNVRELENTIQRAVLLSRSGVISPNDLGIYTDADANAKEGGGGRASAAEPLDNLFEQPFKESVAQFEAQMIRYALDRYEGRIDAVCKHLRMPKTTLYEKMKRYSISAKDYKGK
jgi:two-component system C4-dicarboxylate transport response regulator DctD